MPASLQGKVILEFHEDGVHGHLGVRKTVFAIRRRYYFRKLRSAVARYIQKCVPCIRTKSAVQPADLPLQPFLFLSTIPFNAVSIDLYSPGIVLESGHKYVLTVVDLCTRWVQFIPIKSKLASEVLVNLCRHWFHFHGIPEFVLSDRGKEFMGVMTTVCGLLGIKQIRTTLKRTVYVRFNIRPSLARCGSGANGRTHHPGPICCQRYNLPSISPLQTRPLTCHPFS